MRSLGMATFVVGAAAVLAVAAVGIRSLPDIRRYLKIRSM